MRKANLFKVLAAMLLNPTASKEASAIVRSENYRTQRHRMISGGPRTLNQR